MDDLRPTISIRYADGATIATLMDEKILEEAAIRRVEDSIIPLIEQAGRITLVLDFSNVNFLSSTMLGVLIRISKRVYERNGKLGLCGISERIYKIFKITRLDKAFEIYANADKALSGLSETGRM